MEGPSRRFRRHLEVRSRRGGLRVGQGNGSSSLFIFSSLLPLISLLTPFHLSHSPSSRSPSSPTSQKERSFESSLVSTRLARRFETLLESSETLDCSKRWRMLRLRSRGISFLLLRFVSSPVLSRRLEFSSSPLLFFGLELTNPSLLHTLYRLLIGYRLLDRYLLDLLLAFSSSAMLLSSEQLDDEGRA